MLTHTTVRVCHPPPPLLAGIWSPAFSSGHSPFSAAHTTAVWSSLIKWSAAANTSLWTWLRLVTRPPEGAGADGKGRGSGGLGEGLPGEWTAPRQPSRAETGRPTAVRKGKQRRESSAVEGEQRASRENTATALEKCSPPELMDYSMYCKSPDRRV